MPKYWPFATLSVPTRNLRDHAYGIDFKDEEKDLHLDVGCENVYESSSMSGKVSVEDGGAEPFE